MRRDSGCSSQLTSRYSAYDRFGGALHNAGMRSSPQLSVRPGHGSRVSCSRPTCLQIAKSQLTSLRNDWACRHWSDLPVTHALNWEMVGRALLDVLLNQTRFNEELRRSAFSVTYRLIIAVHPDPASPRVARLLSYFLRPVRPSRLQNRPIGVRASVSFPVKHTVESETGRVR